jgi:ankyrin repeat protein
MQDWGLRMLHVAIRDVKLLIFRLLIELGADVNFQEEGLKRTPLHTAAFWKDKRFVQLLLENKANPSNIDKDGQTPLHQVILNGFEETTTCPIEHSSDVNARTSSGKTPLLLACGFRLQKWDDSYLSARLVRKLPAKSADVSQADTKEQTALHCALETIKALTDAGADLKAEDSSGRSVMHYFGGSDTSNYEPRHFSALKDILGFLLEVCNVGAENMEYEGVGITAA